jgi:preprotein translocase subunit YajC
LKVERKRALNLLLTLLAQTTNPATQPAQPPGIIQYMPFIFLAVLMYFFLIKGRRNQDKQRNDLLAKLKPGQRIQTIGGVLGTVTQVNEKEVTVKVDETNNVKIKFTRGAIHRVLDDEKTETK